MVDIARVRIGEGLLMLSRKLEGLQVYVWPPDPVNCAFWPKQIVVGCPALATGALLTFTITCCVPVQAPSATVTLYRVVATGEATGLEIPELFNPAAGTQLN